MFLRLTSDVSLNKSSNSITGKIKLCLNHCKPNLKARAFEFEYGPSSPSHSTFLSLTPHTRIASGHTPSHQIGSSMLSHTEAILLNADLLLLAPHEGQKIRDICSRTSFSKVRSPTLNFAKKKYLRNYRNCKSRSELRSKVFE